MPDTNNGPRVIVGICFTKNLNQAENDVVSQTLSVWSQEFSTQERAEDVYNWLQQSAQAQGHVNCYFRISPR
jgi:hypothetical protein